MSFEFKSVAIINKELPQGTAMNAIAHMSLGLGNNLETKDLHLSDYVDQDGNVYPNISDIPFIVLRAKSNEIRKLVVTAREKNIAHNVFLNTMIEGGYKEQIERTKHTKEEDLVYYGAFIFGPWDEVSAMTKKLSLWK